MSHNPFDHHHHHHHHDSEEDEALLMQDPAQQSLNDALRVSFFLLLILMICIMVFYAFSGIFTVQEQQKAVLLQFGRIVGDPGRQVYGPGTYLALPYPIQQKEVLNVNERSIPIRTSFWYEISQQDAGRTADEMAGRSGPLNPERDGSLITADANIVHARFNVTYVVDDPVAFLTNVGLAAIGHVLPDGQVVRLPDHRMAYGDLLVRTVAEQVIVDMVGRIEADRLIRQQVTQEQSDALARVQAILNELNTGLRVTNLVLRESQMPLPVRGAYNAVTNAESEKAEKIDAARKRRNQILGEVGGEAALPGVLGTVGPLVQLMRSYEDAVELGDTQQAAALGAEIAQAFERKELIVDGQRFAIGGRAARIIDEAQAYRTSIVERFRSEARTFQELLEGFRANPQLMVAERWQNTRAQILAGDVETFYIRPGSHLWLDTQLDPSIARAREEARLRQEDLERRQQGRTQRR